MFTRLQDIPDNLGDIDGVEYDADIPVRITTNPKLRNNLIMHMKGERGYDEITNLTLDKNYRVTKIISYGDVFDVVVTNDLGEEETFGEWIFEDIN